MKKKEFKDLKQLDRIEYYLYNEHIRKYFRPAFPGVLYEMIRLGFMFLVLAILMYAHFESTALLGITSEFMTILKYVLGTIFALDVISFIIGLSKRKKLKERFNIK